VLGTQSGARVVPQGRRGTGQSKGVIKFAVGEQSSVAGDCRVVDSNLIWLSKSTRRGSLWRVNYSILSFGQ